MSDALVAALGGVVIAYFVLLHTASAVLLLRAAGALRTAWDVGTDPDAAPILASAALPTVSIIVTGTAPGGDLATRLHALLALRYPRHEVVVVLDDVRAGCLAQLTARFALYEVPPAVLVNVPTGPVRAYYRSREHGKLFVIEKASRGLADDLNAAVNASRFPYVLLLDADTLLSGDGLERLMRPFLIGERIAAVAAAVRIGAEPLTPPSARESSPAWRRGIEALARLRHQVFLPLGWNAVGGQLPAAGAVLLHRREHLLELDGFRADALDPGLDFVARLRASLRAQRLPDAIPTIPDPVASSSAIGRTDGRRPGTARLLLDVVRLRHTRDLGLRRTPVRLAAAIHLFAGLVVAPLVELVGYAVLLAALLSGGAVAWYAPLFLLAVPGFALMLSLWTIALERAVDPRLSLAAAGRLALHALAEQIGYRQWAMLRDVRDMLRRRGEPSGGGHAEPLASDDPAPAADGLPIR